MFLEKQILDHIGYALKKSGYRPSKEEQKCMDSYDRSPVLLGLTNLTLFGSLAYYTFTARVKFPVWLLVWGGATVVTAPMAGMYLGAKVSCRTCLQCFLNVEDKKSELYAVTKLLLEKHHPNAAAYFAAEKNVPPLPIQQQEMTTTNDT